ncbi:MAG TPA: hypothetical protein VL307_17995, partial [Chitinophagaceae bacterium]|nr:hypothetical protein [Chitinophagaceae bacterium]
MWKQHHPRPGANPIAMQDDLHELSTGFFKGLLCAHYLVEAAQQRWDLLKKLYGVISRVLPNLAGKIEKEDFTNFTQVNVMIDTLEMQVHKVNKYQNRIHFVIARSFLEFENAIKKGQIPIAHTIEGGHALGRLKPLSPERIALRKAALQLAPEPAPDPNDSSRHIQHLIAFKARGVCLMTLGHFFENDLVHPVEGISPDTKAKIGMKWEYSPSKDCALEPIGVDVVNKMLD